MPTPVNEAFLRIHRRAEQAEPEFLAQTWVEVGPLFTLLRSGDHQVMYGRRGTGKTHALQYLRAQVETSGDCAVFVDLRTIGSVGGIYADQSVALTERGTRLLSDVLAQIIDALMGYVLRHADDVDQTAAMRLLDRLDAAAVDVRVTGEHELERSGVERSGRREGARADAGVSGTGAPTAQVGLNREHEKSDERSTRVRATGVQRHTVHFGQVSSVLRDLLAAIPAKRIWVLLDEWVAVPMDLQPLLADLLRRALLPIPGLVVKIAAIEQRSLFRTNTDGDYLGFELGADIQADLDLDDYMVFDNDAEKAKGFFRELLFRHVTALMEDEGLGAPPSTAMELQKSGFTQRNAIDDFVRAAEGVPRDAINILRIAAQRADTDPIGVEHVRTAARRWYLNDKEKDVPEDAKALLHWIVDTVIGERKARACLLKQGEQDNPLISVLYDARVLHVIKRGVSAQHEAGRFDVYAIDYGCYVELINTSKAPLGLFETDEGEHVEVPINDYRSIRRAIIDLNEFSRRSSADGQSAPTTLST